MRGNSVFNLLYKETELLCKEIEHLCQETNYV
jgi:hypothetical protein